MNRSQSNEFLLCLSKINITSYAKTLSAILRAGNEHEGHPHQHVHDDVSADNQNLTIAKITAMFILFFTSSMCGLVPFLLNRHFKWTDINTDAGSAVLVKCLLYFGGGVLLSTTFMHLLPEVQEAVSHLLECGIIQKYKFPVAELLMCLGFLAMFLIEELTFSVHAYFHRSEKTVVSKSSSAIASSAQDLENIKATTYMELKLKNHHQYDDLQRECTAHHHVFNLGNSSRNDHSQLQRARDQNDNKNNIASALRGFLMVLALSLHELIEGMTIGLESSTNHVWFMFGAVSVHKLVLAFCLGVEMIISGTQFTLSMIYVITFAIVSPMGIGVGIFVSQTDDSTGVSISSVVMQGLATGTLLYIVFFEILSKDHSGLIPYLVFFMGFAGMFALEQFFSHEHLHSHTCGPAIVDISNDKKNVLKYFNI